MNYSGSCWVKYTLKNMERTHLYYSGREAYYYTENIPVTKYENYTENNT